MKLLEFHEVLTCKTFERTLDVSFLVREIQMSIAASRLEKIGHHMRHGLCKMKLNTYRCSNFVQHLGSVSALEARSSLCGGLALLLSK